MFSSFGTISLPRFGFGRTSSTADAINIPPVKVHDIETSTEKSDRTLKHLIKLNHANFSILYNKLRFHNHTPHLLGSAYLFGAPFSHLNDIYEDASANEGHEPWTDSPCEIALHDYREFLGKRDYQRAWVDFFEDQLILDGYEWKNVVQRFLFERGKKDGVNEEPIVHCLTAGLGHPLIHLGYAYELNSREVAMEALGLAATCYDAKLAGLLERGMEMQNVAKEGTTDLFEVFANVHKDSRLDGLFTHPGGSNLERLFSDEKLTSILMEHFASWKITDPEKDFRHSQILATALLIASNPDKPVNGHGWDFFLVHLLTTSHAVRVLIPFLEAKCHLTLVKEWVLIALAIYIAQSRPLISVAATEGVNISGRDWKSIGKQALEGEHKFDAHFVKACRAMQECERVWGGNDVPKDFWIKSAIMFVDGFEGWGGFGEEDEDGMN